MALCRTQPFKLILLWVFMYISYGFNYGINSHQKKDFSESGHKWKCQKHFRVGRWGL